MTEQEAGVKCPNIAKLADTMEQLDERTRTAALFLLAAMAAMNGAEEEARA